MRKVIGNVGILVVVVALLAGCNDMEEPSTDTASSAQPEATPEAPVTESEIVEVEVEPLVVEISTQVALRSDRRLMVEGKSNLPDGTQVRIVVEREISRVRWQARTQIENGQFAAGPFGSGSGLPDGSYDVRVEVSEGSVQPVAVQARIGHEGQHLAGELVSQSRHGLGQVATYSQRFLVGSEPRQTRDQVEVLESPGR
ncbi:MULTISPECIES: hypothetical protein [Halomonadaceae]|uniref:Lipoprotein n=2 Tax=Vreelandella TaxID=3137766 RepID=A0A7Z0LQX4_9GAMM|nr:MULTISPECIES: hypothetical protein [Halomonas]NYS76917.1 hypothetical protein [Halomonas glaciei]|tara:strand:+ start:19 stop:615 length:597 start_codon:yes stop_codon:yes gene_type:complete